MRLARDAGLHAGEVRSVLESDDFGQDVRTDLALAAQIGITAVPTFVLDQKYGVSGAQGVEPMLQAIRYAWEDQGNRPEPVSGGCCGGGGCGGAAEESASGTVVTYSFPSGPFLCVPSGRMIGTFGFR